jgi:hypothetical protein
MRTITTKQINNILAKQNRGEGTTRTENFIYQGIDGTLNNNFIFTYTADEMKEYVMCAKDPIYFIEKYCKFFPESLDKINLYAFQKEWITKYQENRFLLQSISDQTNYYNITACYYLWYMIFDNDKSILIIPSKKGNGIDLLQKISNMYRKLPYFLKPALTKLSNTHISFINNMSIKVNTNNNGSNPTVIHLLDFQSKSSAMLGEILALQACKKESKLIVHSNPKTGGDFFKKLVTNADRKENDPQKNLFNLVKTYWWEVPNRDMKWREDRINEFGEDFFNGYFDNLF